jgi:hypothetical protein
MHDWENEMRHTHKNSFAFVEAVLLGILFLACSGCDNLIPDAYKEKNYSPAEMDQRAGRLLTLDTLNDAQGLTFSFHYGPLDSSGLPIHPGAGTGVTFDSVRAVWSTVASRTLASVVDSATGASQTDDQIMSSSFDLLVGKLPPLNSDSLIVITYPANQAVSYAVLKPGQARDLFIYTSLMYYYNQGTGVSNASDYVTVTLIKKDVSSLSFSTALTPETVYGSYEKIVYPVESTPTSPSQSTRSVPVINGRYQFHVEAGAAYVVRFTLSSPQTISNPLSLIANQFKVAILSL